MKASTINARVKYYLGISTVPATVAMDESPVEVTKVKQGDGEASGAVANEAAALEQAVESQSQPKGILKKPRSYEDAIPHSVEPQELEKEFKEGGKR